MTTPAEIQKPRKLKSDEPYDAEKILMESSVKEEKKPIMAASTGKRRTKAFDINTSLKAENTCFNVIRRRLSKQL
ncbi:hypothetical protein KIN20_003865 [Parelaphostrongylus tenuis]|uniref:Uncharacterized protein n=1 Tax=Parelaphostrongylus tenuis TaxID=148309 RepID=A0AAD5LXI6_PARTN|nr:hypothetical protein KIN20_003865 [Parelaphostrongylus tenuis]